MYKELVEKNRAARNIIVDASTIKIFDADYPRYCSLFSFDETIVQHVKLNESIGGFKGVCSLDAIWFDIDNVDVEQARLDTLEICKRIGTEYGISTDDLFIYFSGKKGFHLAIHGKFLGSIPPSNQLPAQMKNFALMLGDGIKSVDTAIYEIIRMFRMVNSKHEEGLYKIELTYEELNLPLAEIKVLAAAPRPRKDRRDANSITLNERLLKDWNDAITTTYEAAQTEYVGFWETASDGNRHKQLYRQAAMLFDKSELSKKGVYEIMWNINQQCVPPITDLKELVDSAYKKTLSNPKIQKSLITKPFEGWIEEYLDYVFQPTSFLTTGIPSFDNVLRKRVKGKLGCIIGYGGSKKSLLALNACLLNVRDNNSVAVYSTMEMSANQLLDRIIDYIVDGEGMNASYAIETKLNREQARELLVKQVTPILGNRLHITQNASLTCEGYDKILTDITAQTGRVDILVVDGLSMMGGGGKETENYSDNTRQLKELANKWNILILLICHISKGATKHTRDLIDKVRGSEKIIDNCDFSITMSQLIDKTVSTVDSVEYLKHRGYARLYDKRGSGIVKNIIYSFNGEKLMIQETAEEPKSYEVKKLNNSTEENTEYGF